MRGLALALVTWLSLMACGDDGTSSSLDVSSAEGDAGATSIDGGTVAESDVSPSQDTATASSDAAPDSATAQDPVDLAGVCPLDKRYGAFLVEAQEDFSFVDGSVADGVVPVTILEEIESVGACRLLKRNNPFCTPPCGPGQTCDHDGTCIVFPEPQDVGTVDIDGLVEQAVLEPLQPGNSYFLTTLPHPVFEGGDEIHLTSTAGVFGELDLRGVGVDPLHLPEDTTWKIIESADLAITWPAPVTSGVPAVVRVDINIDQHGSSPIVLQCDFPDTGTAVISADLVAALLTSGVSGYPNGRISRRTVDSAAIGDGCMEFIVASPRVPDVRVIGHTPCKADPDCPDGETCNVAMETCS
jgi:hypothetical protein